MKAKFFQLDPNRPNNHVFWEVRDVQPTPYFLIPTYTATAPVTIGQAFTPSLVTTTTRKFEARQHQNELAYFEVNDRPSQSAPSSNTTLTTKSYMIPAIVDNILSDPKTWNPRFKISGV